jgi:biopolymer transport protein ExbB/TolQ
MDMPMRIIIALSIIGGGLLVGIPTLILYSRRRRADKLRRRGIKSYNRGRSAGTTQIGQ